MGAASWYYIREQQPALNSVFQCDTNTAPSNISCQRDKRVKTASVKKVKSYTS